MNARTKEISSAFLNSFSGDGVILCLLAIVLMGVNWGLESKKWQILMRKAEEISFVRAFMAVLSGLTLAVFTPNRIGEYGGRLLFVTPANRISSIAITVVGSISQTVVTIVAGLLALPIFMEQNQYINDPLFWMLFFIDIILIVAIIYAFFNLKVIYQIVSQVQLLKKFNRHLRIIVRYQWKGLLVALAYSTLRYCVFSTQYWLLMKMFGLPIDLGTALLVIPVIFLIQTALPSIAIAELGIRGNVALNLLLPYTNQSISVLGATFSLWFLNLIIPAVFGFFVTLKKDFFNNS